MNLKNDQKENLMRSITRKAQKIIKEQTGFKVTLMVCKSVSSTRTPNAMLSVIASALKMNPDSFEQKQRTKSISELRFLAAIFLRKHFPTLTLKQIGILFGGKDHSSILYSLERGKNLLLVNDLQFSKKYSIVVRAVNIWLKNEDTYLN